MHRRVICAIAVALIGSLALPSTSWGGFAPPESNNVGGCAYLTSSNSLSSGTLFNNSLSSPSNAVINFTSGTTISGFNVGDVITVTVDATGTGSGAGGYLARLSDDASTLLNLSTGGLSNGSTFPQTASYVVTSSTAKFFTTFSASFSSGTGPSTISGSISVTCKPGGSTQSSKLRALQVVVSNVVAQTSGAAISGAVDEAISDQLNGTPALPSFGASAGGFGPMSGLGGPVAPAQLGAAPGRALGPKHWYGWSSIRATGWEIDNSSSTTGLRGEQVNLTFGVGRLLQPGLVVGVLGGYENFDYKSATLDGRMKGDGWTLGSYLGWRIEQAWRFDFAAAWTRLGYDGTAGTTEGSFDADRWLVSTGVTGRYRFDLAVFEPSLRLYSLWENEDSYRDSSGTTQAARSFNTGRTSVGGKVSVPWKTEPGMILTPSLGLYADYRFSSDDAMPTGIAAFDVNDGWSARVTGGLTARFNSGVHVSIEGDVGGITSEGAQNWSGRARVAVPF